MIFFLPEVSKQLWRQSSKYLHSYNILLLAKYFYSRTKCAFVLGGIFLTRCTWGGNRSHGPIYQAAYTMQPKVDGISAPQSFADFIRTPF